VGGAGRPGNRPGGGNNVNNGNINTGDINVGNGNGNWDNDYGWGDNWFPGAGLAVGMATAAIVGSYYPYLPGGCSPYYYGGSPYYGCGGAWYAPQYQGDDITYVVVEQPQGNPDPGAPPPLPPQPMP